MKQTSCSIPLCDSTVRINRGLCSKHYQKFRNEGTLEDHAAPKPAFHYLSEIDGSTKTAVCKVCGPVNIKRHATRDQWLCGTHFSNRVKLNNSGRVGRKYMFGDGQFVQQDIAEEERKRLLIEQNGTCAICKKEPAVLNLDHCHTTGKIRGLLCFACNVGIGHLKDDVTLLQAAIDYLNAS